MLSVGGVSANSSSGYSGAIPMEARGLFTIPLTVCWPHKGKVPIPHIPLVYIGRSTRVVPPPFFSFGIRKATEGNFQADPDFYVVTRKV